MCVREGELTGRMASKSCVGVPNGSVELCAVLLDVAANVQRPHASHRRSKRVIGWPGVAILPTKMERRPSARDSGVFGRRSHKGFLVCERAHHNTKVLGLKANVHLRCLPEVGVNNRTRPFKVLLKKERHDHRFIEVKPKVGEDAVFAEGRKTLAGEGRT